MGRPKGSTKYKFKIGQQYGEWKVAGQPISGNPTKVPVTCCCGTTKTVDAYSLSNGRSTNCGCKRSSGISTTNVTSSFSPTLPDVSPNGTTVYRALVKVNKYDSSINREYLNSLLAEQNYTCAITAEPLTSKSTVVRIDGNDSYRSGNISWVNNSVAPMANTYGVTQTQNLFDRLGFNKQGD